MTGRNGWMTGLLAACVAIGSQRVAAADDAKPAPDVAGGYAALVAEYEAMGRAAEKESEKGKTEKEQREIYFRLTPDIATFAGRFVALAATDPASPAARDALLWVLDKPGMGSGGSYADEFARAVLLLLRHHADDPEVARLALQLDNFASASRDLLLEGLYIRAKGHESRGLARMALVRYLAAKAGQCEAARQDSEPFRAKAKYEERDDDGKVVPKEYDIPVEAQAYQLHLRMGDPAAIRAEARRLAEELIRDFGEVPFITRHRRKLEAAMRLPEPGVDGHAYTPDERAQVEKFLAHRQTLADAARAKLDEMENIVVGKPAPPIEGTGMDGMPLRLADYRGKVVALVFWGTWCGPCMEEVPYERDLAERLKGRPFALLGVDCDEDQDKARAVMAKERITWPNWNDGTPGTGPIASAYHIKGYPSRFILDGRGIIRHIGLRGSGLGEAVDALLKEQEAGPAAPAR